MLFKTKINEYERNNVVRKFPYCDYHFIKKGDHRYGFASNKFKVIEKDYNLPFDRTNPPLEIEGEFALLDWGYKTGYKNIPQDNYRKVIEKNIKLKMQPYGSTYLRMTEIPLIKEDK